MFSAYFAATHHTVSIEQARAVVGRRKVRGPLANLYVLQHSGRSYTRYHISYLASEGIFLSGQTSGGCFAACPWAVAAGCAEVMLHDMGTEVCALPRSVGLTPSRLGEVAADFMMYACLNDMNDTPVLAVAAVRAPVQRLCHAAIMHACCTTWAAAVYCWARARLRLARWHVCLRCH